jgi:hypothetical protein
MATHDYIISNASGAAVRSDLNNALSAIVSNNSSATEPATTYAYQMWADTGSTPAVMKLRDSTNSSWITLYNLDGSSLPIASATEIVFNDAGADLDFRIEGDNQANLFYVDAGNDRIGIGTNAPQRPLHIDGTEAIARFTSTASGNDGFEVGIGTSSQALLWQAENSYIQIATNNTEVARIDSSGRLGIGTQSPTSTLQVSPSSGSANFQVSRGSKGLQINQDSDSADPNFNTIGSSALKFLRDGTESMRIDTSGRLLVGTSTAIGASPLLQVEQTTGAEIALGRQDTSVVANDLMGGVGFWGRDTSGLAYTEQASVKCFADGTHDPGTNPTRLVFSTTSSGSTNPQTRATIDNSGRLLVGTSTALTGGNTQYSKVQIQNNTFGADTPAYLALSRSGGLTSTDLPVGRIWFGGSGTDVRADISAFTDGASSGSSDTPGRLVFSTTADGASSPTERMRINQFGHVTFGDNTATDNPGDANTTTGISLRTNGKYFISCTDDGVSPQPTLLLTPVLTTV